MTRQAFAPFVILSFHAVLHSHLDRPDPFIWHHSTSPPHTLRLRVHRGPLFTRPPPFFLIIFRCAMACSWLRRELCMSLAPTAQSARSWKCFIFLYKTAPRFRQVFRSLAAITTTSAFHMHVFSAAGAAKEVLGGQKRIFQILLSSRSASPTLFLCSSLPSLLSCCLPFPLSHPLLVYFQPLLCGISCCPVWSLKSTPAARPGRAGVVPQQGHTAAWDWRAV